jgi:hypothetical protein
MNIIATVRAAAPLKYSTADIVAIQKAAKKFARFKHAFACIDAVGDSGGIFPAVQWLGAWQKVSLFDPSLWPVGTRVHFFNLDCKITEPFDDEGHGFTMVARTGRRYPFTSFCMAWTVTEETHRIYTTFRGPDRNPFGAEEQHLNRTMKGMISQFDRVPATYERRA